MKTDKINEIKMSFIIFSVEKGHKTLADEINNKSAIQVLESKGISFKQVIGCWRGSTEKSFLVSDKYIDFCTRLAANYGQEALLRVDKYRNGEVISISDGEVLCSGKFKQSSNIEGYLFWTIDPDTGKSWVCEGCRL